MEQRIAGLQLSTAAVQLLVELVSKRFEMMLKVSVRVLIQIDRRQASLFYKRRFQVGLTDQVAATADRRLVEQAMRPVRRQRRRRYVRRVAVVERAGLVAAGVMMRAGRIEQQQIL